MTANIQKSTARRKRVYRLIVGPLYLSIAGLAISGVSHAQVGDRTFTEETAALVNSTMQLAENENYQSALDMLQAEVAKEGLKPYERSTIYQMVGQYSYELDRPVLAQQAFQNAINAGGLTPHETGNIKVVIAQLMIGNGQFREGAERLEIHLDSGGEKKSQYVELLVNAWVQDEDYSRALPWAETWFDSASPKQRKHFELLKFLYKNLGIEDREADITKQMINRWPADQSLR